MNAKQFTEQEINAIIIMRMYAKTEEEFQRLKWKFIAQKLIRDCWEEKKHEIQDDEILRGFDILDNDHRIDHR